MGSFEPENEPPKRSIEALAIFATNEASFEDIVASEISKRHVRDHSSENNNFECLGCEMCRKVKVTLKKLQNDTPIMTRS